MCATAAGSGAVVVVVVVASDTNYHITTSTRSISLGGGVFPCDTILSCLTCAAHVGKLCLGHVQKHAFVQM